MRSVPFAALSVVALAVLSCAAANEGVPCSFESCSQGLGERVSLLESDYHEFRADEPFHIGHGWWQFAACFNEQSEEWICSYIKEYVLFELKIDGQVVDCDFICIEWAMNDTPGIEQEAWRVRWTYTSASLQLAPGIHVLEGTWTAPYPGLAECRSDDHPEQTLSGTHVTTIAMLWL